MALPSDRSVSNVARWNCEKFIGIASDGGDTVLAQQVKHRVRRAIRVILDRVGVGVRELKVRVEAGDLKDALQAEVVDALFCRVEETVVVEEAEEYQRMDKQRRLDRCDRSARQGPELVRQVTEQGLFIRGIGDDVADCISLENAARTDRG